ncbi:MULTISPECIES: 3-keto-disaccharide hydrolase [Pseudomonas]|nr:MULTISPECIES: DUF1080 domain-containing protein [Pseudomonas]
MRHVDAPTLLEVSSTDCPVRKPVQSAAMTPIGFTALNRADGMPVLWSGVSLYRRRNTMIEVLDAHQWRAYQGEDFPLGSWKDDNGILRADPAAARVDLISRQSYRNFSLTFEFSLAAGGNAGVLYRVAESWPESWQGGPEMQLLDNASHPDGQNPLTTHGALYQLLAPTEPTPIQPGEFMSGQLIVRENHVEHWLAGRCVLRYDLYDTALREAISQSKFKHNPDFGLTEGHIIL